MIVLISDGSSGDLRGQSDKISSDLNGDDIVLYYIHVANGQPQQEVYDIANRTGGEAFVAGDPAALQTVFEKIDAMQPAKSAGDPDSRQLPAIRTAGPRCSRCNYSPCSASDSRHGDSGKTGKVGCPSAPNERGRLGTAVPTCAWPSAEPQWGGMIARGASPALPTERIKSPERAAPSNSSVRFKSGAEHRTP